MIKGRKTILISILAISLGVFCATFNPLALNGRGLGRGSIVHAATINSSQSQSYRQGQGINRGLVGWWTSFLSSPFIKGGLRGISSLSSPFIKGGLRGIFIKTVHAATINSSSANRGGTLTSGLVGHWTFDSPDIAGTTAYDKSGQNNTGTATGGVTKVTGKLGQGMKFDGSTGYVAIASSTSLNLSSSSFSVSGWIKVTGGSGSYREIVGKATGDQKIHFLVSATDVLWRWAGFSSLVTLSNNKWYHFVYTFIATSDTYGTETFYVNGLQTNTRTGTVPASIGGDSYIGGLPGNFPWYGLLDDVRIYNRALSAQEVRQLYNMGGDKIQASTVNKGGTLTSGLVGHWTFDSPDIAGTQVYDKSGQNNTGTSSGGVTKVAGKLGQAMKFDGSTGYINKTVINYGKTYTYSAWAKSNNLSTGTVLGGDNNNMPIYITASQVQHLATDYASWNKTLDKNWHHYAVTRNGASSVILYIDGISQGSQTLATNADSSFGDIGDRAFSQLNWNGLIDDVRIYSRALSASEIKQLYNMGGDKIQASTVNKGGTLTSGLMGHWTFDGPDIAGTQVYDKSGQNNTGTITGGVTKVTGKLGQALKFNGSTGYVNVGSSILDSSQNHTVSMWVKNVAASIASYQFPISIGNSVLMVGTDVTSSICTTRNTGSVSYSSCSNSIYSWSSWHYLTFVYDGLQLYDKIYVDGVNVTNTWNAFWGLDSNNKIQIGENSVAPGTYNWNGTIDDVRVWNRALSAQEIRQLYAMSKK